jgi:phosphoribosylaminoimidazole-succinocarboxamide synthase
LQEQEYRYAEVGKLIIEGKTKDVFENLNDPKTVIIVFRDDITAGDGKKHEIMLGKSITDCETNDNIFRLLNKHSIPTHYICKIANTVFLAKKLKYKFPLEVVTRRIAYGSILKRSNFSAGHHFKKLYTEFFYKDDFLHDPRLDDNFIKVKDPDGYFKVMRDLNETVFRILEKAFRKQEYQLIDFKLEYGKDDNDAIIVIDEITAGSMRLWPFKTEKPDFSANNMMSQLDPGGMKDKELFRQGRSQQEIKSGFKTIADLTKNFPL